MYLIDLRFLSSANDVQVKYTDHKTLKYENKKNHIESALVAGKKSYCERRGLSWVASSKRPARLRDHLRELEDHLRDEHTLLSHWQTPTLLCLVFSSGLLSYVVLNPHTANVVRILFDRYCVGKIPANATGAVFTENHLVFTFAENFTTLVAFNSPSNSTGLEELSNRDPKCQTIELYGPSRKCEKHVSVRSRPSDNGSQEIRMLVWSASVVGELFPWSPAVRGEDRANAHIYTLNKGHMELLCYHRVENEVLSVELSQLNENVVFTVQQNTYEKGGLLQCGRYEIDGASNSRTLRHVSTSGVCVPGPARQVCRSRCETRVLVVCIDATLLIHHEIHNVTRSIKAAFIPSMVRWADGIVLACEEQGRLQCFDLSLTPLPASSTHEDAKFIDIGAHLKRQCTVVSLEWNAKRSDADTNPQFVMCFEGGPVAILHITLTDTVQRWLSEGNVSRVTSLLRSLSWDTEGDTCLHILHTTVKHLFRKPLSPSSELLLQEALGSYHMPPSPLTSTAVAEYGAPVHDLTRKFFHHLVRYKRLDKALSLAVDLGDSDLFMDVMYAARKLGNLELAQEAHQHAVDNISEHSTCSESCCSQCTSDSASDIGSSSEDQPPIVPKITNTKPQFQRVAPPLPFIPTPSSEPPLPVPVIPQEPSPVHSIRPNLHQYLDRETALWNNVHYYEKKPTHKVVDIIPRPSDDDMITQHYNRIYQMELKETNGNTSLWHNLTDKRPYKSVYSQKSAMASRYPQRDIGYSMVSSMEKSLSSSKNSLLMEPKATSSRHGGEKNVKFSDTVTIAVVPEIPRKDKIVGNISLECGTRVTDPRKELADSLPLCHPNHDYLKDFAPVSNENNASESQGKIKVVHFGMV